MGKTCENHRKMVKMEVDLLVNEQFAIEHGHI